MSLLCSSLEVLKRCGIEGSGWGSSEGERWTPLLLRLEEGRCSRVGGKVGGAEGDDGVADAAAIGATPDAPATFIGEEDEDDIAYPDQPPSVARRRVMETSRTKCKLESDPAPVESESEPGGTIGRRHRWTSHRDVNLDMI